MGVVEGEEGEARLVVSSEKPASLVFDSMNPMEEEELEVQNEENEASVFYWCQLGGEDLELWLYVGEVVKSLVQVTLEGRRLEVRLRGLLVLHGDLVGEVEQDSWTWSLQGGKLSLLVTKATPGPWPGLWGREGGSKGEQVTELREDTVLPHLTSESPLTGLEQEAATGLNTEELEACDQCETEDRLEWLGGGEEAVASLEGRQHLLLLPSLRSPCPQVCTRHDVDGLVWRLHGQGADHVATLPALGYVQASKTQRKFLAAPASARYCCIADSSRHIYIYRQPEALAPELGLRNRRSGEQVAKVAKQQVVSLEQGEVVGLVAGEVWLAVLTARGLTVLAVD